MQLASRQSEKENRPVAVAAAARRIKKDKSASILSFYQPQSAAGLSEIRV
jgi:hypothetical protein